MLDNTPYLTQQETQTTILVVLPNHTLNQAAYSVFFVGLFCGASQGGMMDSVMYMDSNPHIAWEAHWGIGMVKSLCKYLTWLENPLKITVRLTRLGSTKHTNLFAPPSLCRGYNFLGTSKPRSATINSRNYSNTIRTISSMPLKYHPRLLYTIRSNTLPYAFFIRILHKIFLNVLDFCADGSFCFVIFLWELNQSLFSLETKLPLPKKNNLSVISGTKISFQVKQWVICNI